MAPQHTDGRSTAPLQGTPTTRPHAFSFPRILLTALLLSLLLFSALVAPWPVRNPVFALALGNPNPPIKPPAWLKPQRPITPPAPYTYVKPDPHYRYVSQPHSWPVTMKPTSLPLTTGVQHFLSNDGRLGVDVVAGTIDTSELQQAGGSITLRITQLLPGSGGTFSDHIIFSTYQLQLLAANGSALTTLVLLHPITFSFHLFSDQAALVWQGQKVYAILRGGDASTLLPGTPPTVPANQQPSTVTRLLFGTVDRSGLTWSVASDLTIPAQAPLKPMGLSHGKVSQQGNPSTQGDFSQLFAVAPDTITFGTQAPQALWGTPQDSQVDLNSGGLTYSYPLDLPPGPGGLVPPLSLSYASGQVDESHNLQATAPWVGTGWNLSLGSITWSQENVTPGGSPHIENIWQFNDPSGISGQLIPPNLSASTIQPYSPPLGTDPLWFTAPTNHAKIKEIPGQGGSYPCWQAYFPNGIMEEFGCNDTIGSDQSFKVNGNWERYRWDLDLIVDRYGNQIHFNYQRIWDPSHSWIQDAVLSDIEYDDPTCHQQTACSNWNPQVKLIFDASTVVQHPLNSLCSGWNNTQFRCDDPVNVGGIPVPEVLNSFVLNDMQVQVKGNLLREYVFSYTQQHPQTITDPYSGQQESIAGYLNLNRIQENGVNNTPLNAPTINLTYAVKNLHYFDLWYNATPINNCDQQDSWAPINQYGNCSLWSRTVNSWYLTNIDNGRGWNETISWQEGHNNTHGVDSGAIDEPATCNPIRNSTNRCGAADDKNWSHYMVTQRQAVSNGETSTWTYKYWLVKGLGSNFVGACTDPPNQECTQGFTWGNQNDNDQSDYYNGLFTSYAHVQVIQPDGSYQDHYYNTTTGWGIATDPNGPITCYISQCAAAPYFTNQGSLPATALAGHELHELDYGSDGSMLRQLFWTSEPDCQPTGFPVSGGGPPNNPGDIYLISQLDQNNPVVACDPRLDQLDTYQMDGVTNINDSRVVHTQVNYTYDGDDQGVTPYDYGNVSDTSTSSGDLGSGVYVDAHDTTYPHDNIDGGIFLTNLPAVSQVRNGGGTPASCSQFVYGSKGRYDTSPDVPAVTQVQTHTVGGTSGCGDSSNQIYVSHTYDSSGNPVSSTDGDGHTGCTLGSSSYSACAVYDASTYDTHLTSAANALNQTTSYAYDPGTAGGFGQWLTSMTDVNGQATTYQYDVLGRLTATVRPGDSPSSPTISYTYSNTCTQGATTPCIELDTAVRYTIGGPTSTTKQFYDGWGRLIETQAPSPNSGQTIISYTVYYNDGTNGNEVITSLPYAIATPSGYVAPDLTQARSVTKYDGLGRSYGVTTFYSGGSNIAMESTISYIVAQGVTGIGSDSSTPFEQTITLDSYNHQSIAYSDALGRVRYSQVFSGTGSYSMVRTVGYSYDVLGDVTAVNTYDATGTIKASYAATFDAIKRLTGYNDSDLGSCSNTPLPPGCSGSGDTAWHFTYDADNNQLSQTDPRNQSTYASYDNLDRPLCRGTTSASVNPCQNSTYAIYFYDSYDHNSNPSVTFPAGCTAPSGAYTSAPVGRATAEVFSSSAGSGWRCYGYDQRGEPDQSTLSVTADGKTSTNTMNMSYNDGGELASLVYPDQETLTSQYDTDGHLLSVYFGTPSSPDPVNFLVGQASYNNNGLLAGLSMGGSGSKGTPPTNSVFSTSYGYDGIQRPQSSSVTEGGNTIWSQARTYDNVGNVLQLATTVPTLGGGSLTENQSFCYDALDRLVWAGNTGSPSGGDHCGNAPGNPSLPTYQQSFSYDSLDRLTSGPSGTMTYDPNHVHAADSASTFPNQYASYDAMGNMTCRNVDTGSGHTCAGGQSGALMSYDNEGRLSGWTAPSGTTASDSFLYDNEGNRVLQRTNDSNGITDTITFDSYLEIVLHNGTTSTTKYYSVGGQRVAMRVGGTLTNPLYYLVNDMQGGTSLVLTSGGGVQAVQLYAPYGAVRYSQGTVPTTYNYTGQRLDSETGLLYYGFRYYDPVVGQFVRADTVETNAGGMDGYGYVGENPETLSDPTGHFFVGAGDGNGVTKQAQQQYDYHYAISQSLGESGLPVLLDMYLYHHDVWVQVESYAQEQLHSSTQMLLALEAIMLIHTKGIDWNANNTMRQMFLQVNGLGLPVGLAAAGLGVEGGEMATAMDVEKVAAESEEALAENVAKDEGGPCSFTPATLVTMEHGRQAIGTLRVGEEVLAYNPRTHRMEEEPILHVWINHDNDLVDLTLTTVVPAQHGKPSTKMSEVIHTNQKHPFFTAERGFVPVGQITVGMHILKADGKYGVVTGWRSVSGTQVMYNLEVAQDHTFTVGQGQWVVHNSGPACGGGNGDGKVYSANGDPALRGTRRGAFGDMMTNGVDVNGENFKLSEHAYNDLFKSGRRDIMPDDITDALAAGDPQPANPGSVQYTNPVTGTRVFVNPDTGVITGIWPSSFR